MAGLIQLNQSELFQWVARLAVLLVCLPIHEFAHALAAYKLGDNTADKQGRLTLNPFAHLDVFGSLMILFVGFGWAKPVPVNPAAFKNPRRDMALVAFAGPFANIVMATLLMAIIKIVVYAGAGRIPMPMINNLFVIVEFMIYINLVLAVFNLLPVPPLDGSKLLGALLPARLYFGMMRYERVGMSVLLGLIIMGILTGYNILGIIIGGSALRLFPLIDLITRPVDMIFMR